MLVMCDPNPKSNVRLVKMDVAYAFHQNRYSIFPPAGLTGPLCSCRVQPNQQRLAAGVIVGCGCVCSTADVLALWLVVRLEALTAFYSLSEFKHMWPAVVVEKGTPWLCQRRGTDRVIWVAVMMIFHTVQATVVGYYFRVCVCLSTGFCYLFRTFSGINTDRMRTNSLHGDQRTVLM